MWVLFTIPIFWLCLWVRAWYKMRDRNELDPLKDIFLRPIIILIPTTESTLKSQLVRTLKSLQTCAYTQSQICPIIIDPLKQFPELDSFPSTTLDEAGMRNEAYGYAKLKLASKCSEPHIVGVLLPGSVVSRMLFQHVNHLLMDERIGGCQATFDSTQSWRRALLTIENWKNLLRFYFGTSGELYQNGCFLSSQTMKRIGYSTPASTKTSTQYVNPTASFSADLPRITEWWRSHLSQDLYLNLRPSRVGVVDKLTVPESSWLEVTYDCWCIQVMRWCWPKDTLNVIEQLTTITQLGLIGILCWTKDLRILIGFLDLWFLAVYLCLHLRALVYVIPLLAFWGFKLASSVGGLLLVFLPPCCRQRGDHFYREYFSRLNKICVVIILSGQALAFLLYPYALIIYGVWMFTHYLLVLGIALLAHSAPGKVTEQAEVGYLWLPNQQGPPLSQGIGLRFASNGSQLRLDKPITKLNRLQKIALETHLHAEVQRLKADRKWDKWIIVDTANQWRRKDLVHTGGWILSRTCKYILLSDRMVKIAPLIKELTQHPELGAVAYGRLDLDHKAQSYFCSTMSVHPCLYRAALFTKVTAIWDANMTINQLILGQGHGIGQSFAELGDKENHSLVTHYHWLLLSHRWRWSGYESSRQVMLPLFLFQGTLDLLVNFRPLDSLIIVLSILSLCQAFTFWMSGIPNIKTATWEVFDSFRLLPVTLLELTTLHIGKQCTQILSSIWIGSIITFGLMSWAECHWWVVFPLLYIICIRIWNRPQAEPETSENLGPDQQATIVTIHPAPKAKLETIQSSQKLNAAKVFAKN